MFIFRNPVMAQNSVSSELIDSIMRHVVTDKIINITSEVTDSIIYVANDFLPWDSLSFYFPQRWLPANSQERDSIIYASNDFPVGSREDLYNCFYVFAFPITDSLFSISDRTYMLNQIREYGNIGYKVKIWNSKVLPFDYRKKTTYELERHYGYTLPILSKNLQYAVIRRYMLRNWDEYSGGYFGSFQTLIYKKQYNRWSRIFTGPLIIIN